MVERLRRLTPDGKVPDSTLFTGGLLNETSETWITRSKVMLCVWWDWKDITYYELLPPGKTINSDLYCQQLMRHKREAEKKQPESINRKSVVFHHVNLRPRTSLAAQ
ncbi:Mariner Mos1 transposase [Eumeta japonica]|uniref:Mariner Mos1 transposase n=1 Tax=Eumeta variegata TaxID=151549 RepID=A0A4C1WGS2_EUMVA|nr:Mariner Mos1 transposase [Eumeta japonica]